MTETILQECNRIWSRILTGYDILMQRRDKETNQKLKEIGIAFNIEFGEILDDVYKVLVDTWRKK